MRMSAFMCGSGKSHVVSKGNRRVDLVIEPESGYATAQDNDRARARSTEPSKPLKHGLKKTSYTSFD